MLTWNVRHLGTCLKEDDVDILRATVCVILQTADVIILQHAEKVDLSCLPCNEELKNDYEWPGKGSTEELKILVKTKFKRSFSVKKLEKCEDDLENNSKKHTLFNNSVIVKALSVLEHSEISEDNEFALMKDDFKDLKVSTAPFKGNVSLHTTEDTSKQGEKREMYGQKRGESTATKKDLNYILLTVKADLNSGQTFILGNIRLPDNIKIRRKCFEKILKDVKSIQDDIKTPDAQILLAGDFEIDTKEGEDDKGKLVEALLNVTVGNTIMTPVIKFRSQDPVTTIDGRRVDNILASSPLRKRLSTIGPRIPFEPPSPQLKATLQRLYNNYMVALYTGDNSEKDKIYDCMKAFQLAGKVQLNNVVCKADWVPSSYISDHLPHVVTVKIPVEGQPGPTSVKIGGWNIDGENLKKRLHDPEARTAFLKYLKRSQVVVFHEFPKYDPKIASDEMEFGDILRLKQKGIETEFAIFQSSQFKGKPKSFLLKFTVEVDNDNPNSDKKEEKTVVAGLFKTKLNIESAEALACLYMVNIKEDEPQETIEQLVRGFIPKILKDVDKRPSCNFHLLFLSVHAEPSFDLKKEVYKDYKIINMGCEMQDGQNIQRYVKSGTSTLHDYVIILNNGNSIDIEGCTIELPGDEAKRGFDKIADFKELSLHYPFSAVLK